VVSDFGSVTCSISIHRPKEDYRYTVSLSIQVVYNQSTVHDPPMPKLWNDTIEAHRNAVRDATLETTARLVSEHGLRAVTMSQIAEATGIGRATLYKYFPDVETILSAWHERQIAGHLEHLAQVRGRVPGALGQLEAVLAAYAQISSRSRHHHGSELAAFLHRGEQVAQAQESVRDLIRNLILEGARAGDLRNDIAPDELASYCLHALSAADPRAPDAANNRLVSVILDGLRRRS
jgi:AcrR family transcriptional regulator